MAKKYDVVATIREDGKEKPQYINCGACFEKDGRLSIKLNSLPLGPNWNGWLSLFEPRDKAAPEAPAKWFKPVVSDDIPF